MRFALFLALALTSHATQKPAACVSPWEICRDACAAEGAVNAAVVGSVKRDERPQCMCQPPPETP